MLQHHGVNAGDTICVFRNLASNELTVEVLRGAGPPPPPAGASCSVAAAAAAVAAALGPQPQPQEPVPTFAAGQLPGLAWTLGPRGGKRTGGPAVGGPAAGGLLRSPAGGEEDDDYWDTGAEDGNDGDYSPTAKGRGGKRSAAAAKGGPLAVRRALNKPRSGSSDGSDQVGRGGPQGDENKRASAACLVLVVRSAAEVGAHHRTWPNCCTLVSFSLLAQEGVYTAEQLARFEQLVDVAARLSHPQQLQH